MGLPLFGLHVYGCYTLYCLCSVCSLILPQGVANHWWLEESLTTSCNLKTICLLDMLSYTHTHTHTHTCDMVVIVYNVNLPDSYLSSFFAHYLQRMCQQLGVNNSLFVFVANNIYYYFIDVNKYIIMCAISCDKISDHCVMMLFVIVLRIL